MVQTRLKSLEEQKPQCHVCRILVTYDLACVDATILMTLLPVEREVEKVDRKGKITKLDT